MTWPSVKVIISCLNLRQPAASLAPPQSCTGTMYHGSLLTPLSWTWCPWFLWQLVSSVPPHEPSTPFYATLLAPLCILLGYWKSEGRWNVSLEGITQLAEWQELGWKCLGQVQVPIHGEVVRRSSIHFPTCRHRIYVWPQLRIWCWAFAIQVPVWWRLSPCVPTST